MQFYLDQVARNEAEGLACLKSGKPRLARQYLLMASRNLLEAAKRSEPRLRRIRWEKALRLRAQAVSFHIPDEPEPKSDRLPASESERDLTREDGWLVSEKPDVRFAQIAGVAEVKNALRLRVIEPFRHPEAAQRFKKQAGGGMLLYGPPGTGKTLIAKATATELDARFFHVKSSNIMSQWVGVAERNLARLFETARRFPLSVVFLDEAEALVSKRGGHSTVMNRVVPEFLSQVDGLESAKSRILLMGATNRPWDIDEAALRTGRFGEQFYVGLPDRDAREQILRLSLDGIPMEPAVDLAAAAQRLDHYSGADIVGVCTKATDFPFERQIRSGAEAMLSCVDLERAIGSVHPSVTPAMLDRYRRFAIGS